MRVKRTFSYGFDVASDIVTLDSRVRREVWGNRVSKVRDSRPESDTTVRELPVLRIRGNGNVCG